MNEDEDAAPPLPKDRSVSQLGCIIACGLAILPILYVGSFAILFLVEWFGWGFGASIGEDASEALTVFYWPMIWLTDLAFDALQIQP